MTNHQRRAEYWKQYRELFEFRGSSLEWKPNQEKNGKERGGKYHLGQTKRDLETIATNHDIAVLLVLKDDDRQVHFDRLSEQRGEIEQEIPGKWEWKASADNRRSVYIRNRDLGGVENEQNWHEQHLWLYDTLHAFLQTFGWRLEALDAGGDIAGRLTSELSAGAGRRTPRQANPLDRLKVEDAAVEAVWKHFAAEQYRIKDVSRENLGWDLEAVRGKDTLFIEVKGLSGRDLCVELTPNEYAKMKSTEHCDSWRLCVVTNALTDPQLAIFGWSKGARQWEDERGRVLRIEERIAARCRAQQPAIAGNASLR
ncbi:MAG: DUF4268 domain-containing protein [Planctomycetales bacterium]